MHTKNLRIAALAVLATLVIGVAPAHSDATSSPRSDKHSATHHESGKRIAGQYIVTLRQGENPRLVAASVHASPKRVYEHTINGFAAQLNSHQLKTLRHRRGVQAIEQDQQITTDGFLTETTGSDLQPWGLDRIDQRARSLSRTYSWWSSGTYGAGRGVRAYVIDSGIATANPDFGGRASNVYDAFGGNGEDCFGHGTHVAGTIGGNAYGVAKSVMLRGVRVLDCKGNWAGGSVSAGLAGIDWVTANAIKPAVANISWHAGFKSAAVNAGTTRLVNSGVFVSVAAANDSADACNDSPGSAAGTVTVGASDWNDARASFSDYGACVDLYAPGVNVKSAYLNGTTRVMNGTSMASPHVAGVAALLKSDYGDRTSATIASWILNAATTNAITGNITGTPNRLLYMNGW